MFSIYVLGLIISDYYNQEDRCQNGKFLSLFHLNSYNKINSNNSVR